MGDINAKITVSQNSNDKKEVELVMNETETTGADAQTGKDENASEKKEKSTDGSEKIDLKFLKRFGVLFISLMVIFIGGIFCSVFFIKNIYEPFKNSLNFATCVKLPACVECETCVNNPANIATCSQSPVCTGYKMIVNDSANFVACIQYTVSLALVLAAVIIASISLIKAAKWLIKVDFIKQVLSSSINAEQKKKICDTLADL